MLSGGSEGFRPAESHSRHVSHNPIGDVFGRLRNRSSCWRVTIPVKKEGAPAPPCPHRRQHNWARLLRNRFAILTNLYRTHVDVVHHGIFCKCQTQPLSLAAALRLSRTDASYWKNNRFIFSTAVAMVASSRSSNNGAGSDADESSARETAVWNCSTTQARRFSTSKGFSSFKQ